MYDYISESGNTVHYRQPTPLLYNMTRIPNDIPLFISHGGKDTLSDVNDVQLLLDNLKDHPKDKLVGQYTEDYAHFDFIMAENANRVVYDPLMAFFGPLDCHNSFRNPQFLIFLCGPATSFSHFCCSAF